MRILLLCSLLPALPCQSLVKDIHPGSGTGSLPQEFVVYGDIALFSADDGQSGRELWRTDGTAAGTVLVKDLRPGTASSFPRLPVVAGGKVFFTADGGGTGHELWISDGTAAGTQMVADIEPGLTGGSPGPFAVFGQRVCFPATTSTYGRELWISDGTAAGTKMVFDLLPGLGSANPSQMVQFGREFWFVADDGPHGRELWHTDGTAAGTQLHADLNPGTRSGFTSGTNSLTPLGATLFFAGDDGVHGTELWKTDGTAAGTVLVKDLNPLARVGSIVAPQRAALGLLFFEADDGISGLELWRSDGTAAGTFLLRDILPGRSGSLFLSGMTPAQHLLYFRADDGVNGFETWCTDGSSAGTKLTLDVNPGFGHGVINRTDMVQLGSGHEILFAGTAPATGLELWRSDGTAAGTTLVADLNPGSASGEVLSNGTQARLGRWLVFSGNDGTLGIELHRLDLARLGVPLVAEVGTGCAGTNQVVPSCSARGLPRLGEAGFAVSLQHARAQSPAAFALSEGRSDLALLACTFHLAAPVFSIAHLTDGTGLAQQPLPIPNQPVLLGLELFVQWGVKDPQGAYARSFAFSNALQLLVGQ